MKYTNLRAFEKHLEGAAPRHFAEIYMVLVKDAFERKAVCDKIVATVLQGEVSPGFSLQVFDADTSSIETLIAELQALAFFSARRVIILQQAEKLAKSATEQLEKYFENPNRSICFIIAASAINHATNFFKKAEKVGVVLEIAEEKPWEKERSMQDRMAQKFAKEGKRVDPSVCLALVKQLGTDMSTLYQESEKLICYVGDRQTITLQDLHAVCVSVNSENVWQLGEAIFRRDGATALRITKALLEDGTAFLALLRQIRNQFQTQCQVCSILSGGGTPSDVTSQFPFMRGMILDRNIQQAQSYGMPRLKKGLLAIDDTEVSAKNSGIDSDWLAEKLIIKLAST